jgi:sec-independent protein translocase protein TatC
VFFSTILFVGGALFGYFVVFPFGFRFFLGFANEYIQALPSVKQYFSLSIKLLLGFGLIFELPVVAFFLGRMGVISAELLRKQRKYAILLLFVVSAILTPPDVITQFMMAGPLLILFELSVIIVKVAGKEKAGPEDGRRREHVNEICLGKFHLKGNELLPSDGEKDGGSGCFPLIIKGKDASKTLEIAIRRSAC